MSVRTDTVSYTRHSSDYTGPRGLHANRRSICRVSLHVFTERRNAVRVRLSVAALQRSETAERQSMDSGCLPSNVSEKVQWFTTDDAKHTWH